MKKARKRVLALFLALTMALGLVPISAFAATQTMTLRAESVHGSAGSEVKVKLLLENNPGVASIGLTVVYDDILNLKSVEFNPELGGSTQLSPTLSSPAKLIWVNSAVNFTAENATFATLTFQISEFASDNAVANLTIGHDPEDVYDISYTNVALNVVNGRVTVFPCEPGDINGDSKVNNKDASMLMQYLVGWDVSVNTPTLDTNGDGKVNNKDASLLMQYLAGWDVILHCGGTVSRRCDHEMTATPFKAATCTKEGNIAYWHCSKCGKYFNSALGITEVSLEDTVIGVTHVLEAVAYKEPTVSAPGNIACWHCTACSKYFYNVEATEEVSYSDIEIPAIVESKATVQYDLYGGDDYLRRVGVENPNPSEFAAGSSLTLSPLNAPAGYVFKGWRLVDGTAEGTPVTRLEPQDPGTVIQLRAVWELIEYSITYKNYKTPVGEVVNTNALHYYVNQGKPNLPNPEVKNYVFLGWYDETGEEMESIPAGTTGNIVLDGYWTSLRNLARPKKLEDPIILNDANDGVIYFAYELGTIENIPLTNALWEVQNVAGISQEITYEYEETITESQANNISEAISKSTVDSGTWTLAESWNTVTEVNETWAEQNGMTKEEAETKTKSDSDTYSFTRDDGGNSTTSTTDGTTTLTYNSKEETSGESVELDLSLEASIHGKLNLGPIAKGGYEITGGAAKNEKEYNETKEHTGTDTTKVDTTITNNSSSWNEKESSGWVKQKSQSESVRHALSQIISNTKGYGESYAQGGDTERTQGFSSTDSKNVSTSSTITYSKVQKNKTTKSYRVDGDLEGNYRLVVAGTAHVFGVVGYDVASRSYFAYTYSVMDDKTHEFLDYTPKGYQFNDYENGALPFEVPYFVHEYVTAATAATEGLLYRTDSKTGTAMVIGYNGTSSGVAIPSYISVGDTAYKVTGLSSSAFSGKSIQTISLSRFIDSIPDRAFKNCAALEEISGRFTKIGSEAFSGCTSLNNFNVSQSVTSIGANAFSGVAKITVSAISADAALARAKERTPDADETALKEDAKEISRQTVCAAAQSGAQEVDLDLSTMMDGVALTLDVPAMSRLVLSGGRKTYADLKLVSHASETVIREVAIENYNEVPLEIYSDNLTLEVVSVESSNFAMTLASEHPTISLRRDSALNSKRGSAMVCKDPTFLGEVVDSAVGTLDVSGNVYVCGNVTGEDNLVVYDGEIIPLSVDNFQKFIHGGYGVNLNANGGTISQPSVAATFGQPYGTLPEPTRDHYSFSGWYTEAEGGRLITSDLLFEELNDITLYAHWTLNTFNISLNANGGSLNQSSLEVVYGNAVGALPTPTRSYYNFDGWYTAASGGTQYTSSTVFNTANDINLYAHWTLKPTSSWVLASNVPAGAQTVNQKWTYNQRTNTESRSTSLSGYTQYGSYWVQSGRGSTNYASFPSGFSTSHSIYTSFAKSPYSAYENTTNKRTVSNAWTGYVYYHWAYNAALYNVTARAISSKCLQSGTGGYCYKYFYAFTNSTNYPYLGKDYCNNQNLPSYNCWPAVSSYNAQNIPGLCTPRFFRFDYYTSTYTDYYKMFQYYKIDAKESSSAVTSGGLISNVQHWVQYRAK